MNQYYTLLLIALTISMSYAALIPSGSMHNMLKRNVNLKGIEDEKECAAPEFIINNFMKGDSLNYEDLVFFWRKIHSQMELKYGKKFQYLTQSKLDKFDKLYFEIKDFIKCLASNSK